MFLVTKDTIILKPEEVPNARRRWGDKTHVLMASTEANLVHQVGFLQESSPVMGM